MDNLSPAKGDPATVVDRILDYVTPFGFDLGGRITGADPEMISRYALLAGFGTSLDTLPISYREFLLRMGLYDAGLLKNFRLRAHLPSIIDLYLDSPRCEFDSLSADFPVAAQYIVGDQVSFNRRTGLVDPEIVETSCGEFISSLCCNWECLLMQLAVLQVEPRRLSQGIWLSAAKAKVTVAPKSRDGQDRNTSDVIDSLADKLGLEIAWPSDLNHRIAIGKNTSFFAKISPHGGVLCYAFRKMQQNFV